MLSTTRARAGHRGGSIYKLVDPSRRGNPSACAKEVIPTVVHPTTRKISFRKDIGTVKCTVIFELRILASCELALLPSTFVVRFRQSSTSSTCEQRYHNASRTCGDHVRRRMGHDM